MDDKRQNGVPAESGKAVADSEIVALYFAREERAIAETQRKYGRYCFSIAFGLLGNEDLA